MYWAQIEVVTAIICANLPAMPNFLRHFWRSAKSAISHSASGSNVRSTIDHSNSGDFGYNNNTSNKRGSRGSRSLFCRKLTEFHQKAAVGTRSESLSDRESSASQTGLTEKADGVFVASDALDMKLVPRQIGASHKAEVVSPSAAAAVGNGGKRGSGGGAADGTKTGNHDIASVFPLPPAPRRQHDVERAAAFTEVELEQEYSLSGGQGGHIVRTDRVDVERSLA